MASNLPCRRPVPRRAAQREAGGGRARWAASGPLLLLFGTLVACGGRRGDAEPDLSKVQSSYLPAGSGAAPTAAASATVVTQEPFALVGTAATATVTFDVAGTEQSVAIPLDQAAIRAGDLRTLAFVIGHVKLQTKAVRDGAGATAGFAERVLSSLLKDPTGGIPQIFLESQSVGDVSGVLDQPGATATGTWIGVLQVGDRQVDVDAGIRVTRTDADHVAVDSDKPVMFELSALGLDGARLGVGPSVRVTLHVELTRAQGELPTFVRTPVTLQRMGEMRQRMDDEINDFEKTRERLRAEGLSEAAINALSEEDYERMRARARETYEKWKSKNEVVVPPPEVPRQGAAPR
jgi:hypothetical protein